MEGNSFDVCAQAFAVLAAQYTSTEFFERLKVFVHLHQHWIQEHSVQIICLTCQKDVTSEPMDNSLAKKMLEHAAKGIVHQVSSVCVSLSEECNNMESVPTGRLALLGKSLIL